MGGDSVVDTVVGGAVGGAGVASVSAVGGIKGVTDLVGLTDYEREKELEKQAKDMADKSIALAERTFQFNVDLLNKWNDVYGDVQDNVADFYKNLGPEKIESFGLQAQEKAFTVSKDRISKIYKQRGLSGSGLETSALTDLEVQRAVQRSEIRATAPEKAVRAKQSFLAGGLQEKQTLESLITSAGTGSANIAGQSASNLTQQQIAQQQSNQQMLSDILGLGAAVAGTQTGGTKVK
jgi:hypothetical protein